MPELLGYPTALFLLEMFPYLHLLGLDIPMYGLSVFTGFCVCALYLVLLKKSVSFLFDDVFILGAIALGFGFVGAKLLYILTAFNLQELWSFIKSGQFTFIVNSGMVFYGGFVFGVASVLIFSKIFHISLKTYESIFVSSVPLIHAFGRIGCFCAGCCYGCVTDSVFGVCYSIPLSDAPIGIPLFPVQLLESLLNLCLFILLAILTSKQKTRRMVLPLYLICYAVFRFILEFFRFDDIRGIFFGLSTSQWISIALCVIGTLLLLIRVKQKDK